MKDVFFYTAKNGVEHSLITSLLTENRIRVRVGNESESAGIFGLPNRSLTLFVDETDLEKANVLLKEVLRCAKK